MINDSHATVGICRTVAGVQYAVRVDGPSRQRPPGGVVTPTDPPTRPRHRKYTLSHCPAFRNLLCLVIYDPR